MNPEDIFGNRITGHSRYFETYDNGNPYGKRLTPPGPMSKHKRKAAAVRKQKRKRMRS